MTIIVGFLILIAKFYEDVSGERTYYLGYTVPILCFGGASARYAFNNNIGDDVFANLLWVIGGVTLAFLSVYLYNLMIRRPHKREAKDDDGSVQ
ncbi:MAG: hypothetical protein KF716_01170 [Anaerolineae bacterium]|nr:hypothetical protein [Anaerolineae bacterium]